MCSTSKGCTSRHRSTWPRHHPTHTVDVIDAASRHPGDIDCDLQQQQQQQPAYDVGCPSRQSGVPRRREWVTCVQRQRSAAAAVAAAGTSTTSAPAQRPSTSISAAPAVLRRQTTITSATESAVAVDAAVCAAVSSPSPAATTAGDATSDDELEAEMVLNYETVLRCLDSCDKILLRHSTLIT